MGLKPEARPSFDTTVALKRSISAKPCTTVARENTPLPCQILPSRRQRYKKTPGGRTPPTALAPPGPPLTGTRRSVGSVDGGGPRAERGGRSAVPLGRHGRRGPPRRSPGGTRKPHQRRRGGASPRSPGERLALARQSLSPKGCEPQRATGVAAPAAVPALRKTRLPLVGGASPRWERGAKGRQRGCVSFRKSGFSERNAQEATLTKNRE